MPWGVHLADQPDAHSQKGAAQNQDDSRAESVGPPSQDHAQDAIHEGIEREGAGETLTVPFKFFNQGREENAERILRPISHSQV